MTVAEYSGLIVVALCLLALLGTYIFYPLLMFLLARMRARPWRQDDTLLPAVTMVVAAYNEAAVLEEKIRNFLAIDYPADRLFLIIGSDGSDDGSDEILRAHADGVRIRAAFFERGGKMKTVNRVVEMAETPFLVFSDANTMYAPDAVRRLMRHFADPDIGGVCGNLRLRPLNQSAGGAGESTYWSFENLIKHWEGSVRTVLGATGGIYAIRRALFVPQPEDIMVADDFLLPMRILLRGSRFVYDVDAQAFEGTEVSMHLEFRRKIRVGVCTFNAMKLLRPALPSLSLGVRLMLFAHKRLRWQAPFFILALLVLIPLLSTIAWVQFVLLYPMLLFLLLAVIGLLADAAGRGLGVLSLPFYFLSINTALLIARFRAARAAGGVTWERGGRVKS